MIYLLCQYQTTSANHSLMQTGSERFIMACRKTCMGGEGKGNYLAFLGRISPEKRPDRAIEIAKRTGIPLKIAAKVDKADEEYFET